MAGVNSVGNSLTGSTGSGSFVGSTSPVLVTPTLGAATATSVNFGVTSLSNYTESTFTPTVTCGSPGDLSVVYADQTGVYTRVGRLIQINYRVQFTPTFTTATGVITFSGLPVASAGNNSAFSISGMSTGWTWPLGHTMLTPNTNSGTTDVILQAQGSTVATANTAIQTMLVSGVQVFITFSGVYFV